MAGVGKARSISVAVLLLAAAGTAGCAVPPAQPGLERHPYAWEPERDAAIEDGVFDSMVAGYWLCAWMGDYLQAQETGDRQRGESAVKELEKYATLPSTIASHQDPQAFASHVIDPAAGGDAATLREFFDSSCSGYQRAVDSFR